MRSVAPRLLFDEPAAFRPIGSRGGQGLRDLFAPIEQLLACGGDPRLSLDRGSGLNVYGCAPSPCPEIWSFASSTASSISERAFERAGIAREELMRSAIDAGFDEAFDARIETMREELKAHLRLSAGDVDIVFSPSGTDSQVHALALARSLFGRRLTTVVVGADQTGSGTAYTARGRHFDVLTAGERPVRKDAPIKGLAGDGVFLPLLDASGDRAMRSDADAAVLDAVEAEIEAGSSVLLQIMDCSKLGWRAPSEACLDEIACRWPERVQVLVDACQMRLGRGRIKACLDRGYMVLITGSKYFGGPAFSGALLVPSELSRPLARGEGFAPGLLDYATRSDWPANWTALRSRFDARPNLGQWLRWEAALEEISAYYRVPDSFRIHALAEFEGAMEGLLMLSPSLHPLEARPPSCDTDDEEFRCATVFPFTLKRSHRSLAPGECRNFYRALATDLSEAFAGSAADREVAGRRCLVGQPVQIAGGDHAPTAALRLCVGARLVTEAWSRDPVIAQQNLQREIDRIATVIAKIELLAARAAEMDFAELSYER